MKYFTKNSPTEDLLNEIKRLRNHVAQLKLRQERRQGKVKKVRNEWKERYDRLRWVLFRKDQLIFGKEQQIEKLRYKNAYKVKRFRREGYRDAMNKIAVNNYKVKHLANFLFQTHTVMGIYELDVKEYSFLLWAGRYEFFDKKDFETTLKNVNVAFYATVNKLIKRGLVVLIAKKPGDARRIFSLTGTGVDMFNKLSRFTNKFLRE
jgi:hypothetical protein